MAGKIKSKPRKDGPRGKSGRLLDRGSKEDTIPPFALLRRAEALGLSIDDIELRGRGRVKDGAMHIDKVDGSSNLGILHARGIIGLHHKDAGLRLWDAYRRWKAAIESKPRHAKAMNYDGRPADGPPPVEMDDDACLRAERAYNAAVAAVPKGICWALIEAVVIDPAFIGDTAPRLNEQSHVGEDLRRRLVMGLDALCAHFNITVDG